MGKDYKQRQAYKYLHDMTEEVPINVLKGWDRRNFDVGEYRAKRIKNRVRDIDLMAKNDLTDNQI